jgi:hypothetical protein
MCVNPITLTRSRCGIKVKETVPCGKCPECIKDNQNEFVIRAYEEQKKRGNMWFFTLTYSPSNVPVAFNEEGELVDEELVPRCQKPLKYRSYGVGLGLSSNSELSFKFDGNSFISVEDTFDQDKSILEIQEENKYTEKDLMLDEETGEMPVNVLSLDNRDVKNWKKRVRRQIEYHEGRKLDFGYMICGEYGPRTRRPHYHGVFFGLSDEDVLKFKLDWEKHNGYTCFKKINSFDVERTSKYVSKYINKQECLNDSLMLSGYSVKPRKITSKGFGLPTPSRFYTIKKEVLGDFPIKKIDDLSSVDIDIIKKNVKRLSDNTIKYHLNGKDYKLPQYYKKRIFYITSNIGGKRKSSPSALYNLVQKAIRDRIQKDFTLKCIQLANDYGLPETPETMHYVTQIVCDIDKMDRETRAQTFIERDQSSFRKGKF